MHELTLSVLVGAAAGLAMASLGAFKDTAYEGFSARAFARSIVIACLVAALGWAISWPYGRTISPVGGFLAIIAIERLATEAYKSFIRTPPTGRRVPSQAAIFGKPVQGRGARLALGALFTSFVVLLLVAIGQLRTVQPGAPYLAFGVLCGGLVAMGGAWKDAPIEGWSTLAFARSPLVGGLVGLVASNLPLGTAATSSMAAVTLFFVCLGGERITVESYKAFIRRRCPSKFYVPAAEQQGISGRDRSPWHPDFARLAYVACYAVALSIVALIA